MTRQRFRAVGRLAPARLWSRVVAGAAVLAVVLGVHVMPTRVAASGGAIQLATSTSSMAYQHPAQDKVVYLHDGSLLFSYYDGSNGLVKQIANPGTTPTVHPVQKVSGDEVTLYTLPGSSSTDIWIQAGNELHSSGPVEQIQHGTYDGSAFSWDALTTIPGTVSSGRQDPSVTWTGKWLIATWWDDTKGSNSDNVFMNWTSDKTGQTGWLTSAILMTSTNQNVTQVNIRHSAKLGATLIVYGTRCGLFSRTLLDAASSPSAANWTAEASVDSGADDCESGFGGPQVAIDESNGNIHVFRAVTSFGSPDYAGIIYWLGTPDAAPMGTGAVSWRSRLVIDSSGTSSSDPPDVAGAVASTGKVFIFWVTSVSSGSLKYVTLSSPYTSASSEGTVTITGTQPRYPHIPAQAPLTGGFVPLVYQSGTGSPYSLYFDSSISTSGSPPPPSPSPSATPSPPPAPTGLTATALSSSQISLGWSGSLGATSYNIQRSPDGSTGWIGAGTSASTTFTDAGLSASTTYFYRVSASNGAQDSGPSNVASAATSAPPPTVSTLYLDWFDLASPGVVADNIHLLNTTAGTANVNVSMPGATPITVSMLPGTETYVSFGKGHIGGPVVVSSDQVIRASQRVQYYQTFNEVWAASAPRAATSLYINWYDKASAGMYNDNIHLINPNGTSATVTVSLPGAIPQTVSVGPGAGTYITFPAGTIGGPVTITADKPVLASQRVQYYASFNEVWAAGSAQAATTSYVNWYDKASAGMLIGNIHLLNPGATSSSVTVTIPGAPDQNVTLGAGAETYVTFPSGTLGGPVTITASQPVLASQRVQYYSTFNEVWSENASDAATTKYVNWYDKASAGMYNDNIHLLNPGATSASVTVSIPGQSPQMITVGAGGEVYVTFASGTVGGPVTITASQPVLASQRVQYYGSFNEIWAE